MSKISDPRDTRRSHLVEALKSLRDQYPGASETLRLMAHDLRGPLNAIAMNAELLRALPPDHPSREKKLASIQDSVESMTRLLDALSDIESG